MVFICPFCKARYKLLTNLKRHVRREHRIGECPFCKREGDLCLHSIQFIRHHDGHDKQAYDLHVALWYLTRSCYVKYHSKKRFLRLKRLGRSMILKVFSDET